MINPSEVLPGLSVTTGLSDRAAFVFLEFIMENVTVPTVFEYKLFT